MKKLNKQENYIILAMFGAGGLWLLYMMYRYNSAGVAGHCGFWDYLRSNC